MTITQTVDIPADHLLTIKVPSEVPAGRTILTFKPAADQRSVNHSTEYTGDIPDREGDCPLCAKYRNPETGELKPNAETAAAIREGRAMMRGEVPAKWYGSAEEMRADLDKDDLDD